jgi:hypothetical protein
MSWINRHAPAVEACAAAITACVAVAALIGVKIQLDEAERLLTAAAARDAYRGHLALAVTQPGFAAPLNTCSMLENETATSYVAFVDHLLYSVELMLVSETGWDPVFLDLLAPHTDYICSAAGPVGDTPEVRALLLQFRATSCPATPVCTAS